jgi:hypothetical protein
MDDLLLFAAVLAAGYSTEVLADSPVGYWRLDEPSGTNAADSSGNSHDGTYSGTPTLSATSLLTTDADKAVSFDGSDDYIDLSNPAALQFASAWTLEAWIKVATGQTAFGSLINQHYDGSKVPFLLGSFDGGSETMKPSVGFYNGSWRIAQSATALTTDTIHHLVGTWDGTSLKIYVDGSLKATNTPGSSPSSSTENVWVSRRWDTGGLGPYYKGVIDEIAMYNYDIGATRIAAHYLAGSGSPAATDGTATPSATAGTGAVPSSTVNGAAVGAPSATVGIGAVPGPNASGGATALPGTVAGSGAVPAATAFATAAGTTVPAVVAGIGAVPAPTTFGAAKAAPAVTAGVGAVPAPTDTGQAAVNAPVTVGIGAVPAATAFGQVNATVTPGVVAGTSTVPHPHALGQGTGGGGGSVNGVSDFWSVKALG